MKFYEDERVWLSCDGEYQITQHQQGHFTAEANYARWSPVEDEHGKVTWNTLDEARAVCEWHKQRQEAE